MLYCSTSWQNDPHKRSKKLSLHWQSQKIVRWRCFQVKAHKSWLNSTKFFKVGGHYFKPSKLILNLTEKLEIILKRRVGTVTVESSFLFIIRWLYGRRRRIFRCLAVRRDQRKVASEKIISLDGGSVSSLQRQRISKISLRAVSMFAAWR